MTTTTTAPPVSSWIAGQWAAAPVDDEVELRDAATGILVATAGGAPDLAAAVDYARTVGQASLGELPFHRRALILKALAQALTAAKDELYAVSARTGATPRDSMIDIDGGIGVLFTYASKGRRELPNATTIVDGAPESLSRDGSFGGQHLWSRLPGVAFQVNAFNFPVWGMLEKFAPAFLAGVPSIVKPATPTSYLTEAAVRVMADSRLLPEGSLQLVVGQAHGFLDLLDARDAVGFTGSASTGRILRRDDAVTMRGVTLTTEADSLNAAILGPDVEPGSPDFEAFVASVVTEMTAKAGQKCTAIRRVIVPDDRVDAVIDAVRARLEAKVVLGDPRAEGVTMGPLASLEQRREVRERVAELLAGGGEMVVGSLESPEVRRADGTTGPEDAGAFLRPILLRFADADAPVVHALEAFGPVASVIGYSDLVDAVRLANRGDGSLVATVCSTDPDTVAALVAGISPFHGRVLVLDASVARTSTGHGSPVPHLVHGGPGRAGGGTELGGIRSVLHYMRRTALQGSPEVLTRLTGQWRAGAAADTGIHPFRKSLATLRVGDQLASDLREVTLDDIEHFAEFTGDTFYAHMDEEAAAANPFFPGRVAHGYLLLSFAAGLFVDPAPGPVLANYGLENLRFVTPVSPGDRVRVTLTAKQISPRESEDYGEVRWDAVIRNQDDEIVATYDVLTLVAKEG
ncbi:phenylacetic acid degradation bifunctional protein PaaZ [Microbacterium rhizosphaerae]|uniref:Phenylacetic acid degradation bifunctional protein PaaZ n=1 Tax=Microbacterium rhizosphaerae TaxID=1678237 RepID=A0ABZ0SQW7_9MICO|nr:phenylacetic acid degradation bifunctional protein PaaZ [Microbacterium rhizosphaerae]WPR90696.1 phenylacetic acid degradation bifunctional protein PaaZ [Microbacterium rhizosphaerae]